MFGQEHEDGSFHPFHVYSMMQAIEEKFILDVLQNYVTYNTCFRIAKTVYVPANHKGVKGMDEKTPLDEVIAKINEKFKGNFTEGDKVILSALRDKLLFDKKLIKMAQSSDPQM